MVLELRYLETWVLVVTRLSGLFISAPIFAADSFPKAARAGMVGLIGLLLVPQVSRSIHALPNDVATLVVIFFGEITVGMLLGFLVKLLIEAVNFGGSFMSFSMGLTFSSILDPETQGAKGSLGHFMDYSAMLWLLASNGHHLMLQGLIDSYQVLPALAFKMKPPVLDTLLVMSGQVFSVAFRIGGPVVGVLFVTNMVLGLISRSVTQLNPFFMSFIIGILVGLSMLMLCLPLVFDLLESLVPKTLHTYWALLKEIAI